jgi:hypothetical protein
MEGGYCIREGGVEPSAEISAGKARFNHSGAPLIDRNKNMTEGKPSFESLTFEESPGRAISHTTPRMVLAALVACAGALQPIAYPMCRACFELFSPDRGSVHVGDGSRLMVGQHAWHCIEVLAVHCWDMGNIGELASIFHRGRCRCVLATQFSARTSA